MTPLPQPPLPQPASTRARPPSNAGRRWDRASVYVCIGFALLVLAVFADYGITWDEDVQITYGELVLRWYSSGFTDASALHYLNLMYYGGLFEVLGQLAYRVSPLGLYYTRHLLGGAFGVVGIVYAWRLARELQGPLAGLLGALAFALDPVLFGHIFNNPKDAPFAVAYLAAVYYLVRASRRFPRVPPWLLARLGLATGVALGIRVGGVLLLVYWAAAVALWAAAEGRRHGARAAARGTVRLAARLAPATVLAYAVMLAAWPWGQVDPLRNPLRAVAESARFPWNGNVLFDGATYVATDLPWYYMPKLLLLTLPEFILLGLAVAAVRGVIALRRRGVDSAGGIGRPQAAWEDDARGMDSPEGELEDAQPNAGDRRAYAVVATALLFPLVYACATHATLYDGQRHFLFALPLAGVLAATAYAWVIQERRRAAVVLGTLALASALCTVADMVRLHPYQSVYFNPVLAGGVRGASGRYELDYWGNSYREGAEWLARGYPVSPAAPPPRVASCGAASSASVFLPKRFRYVGTLTDQPLLDRPDLLLATPRFGCDRAMPGRVIHTVSREGAPLLYVIDVSSPAPPPR